MNNGIFLPEKDLWESLKDTTLPIVMYGMGNGADKILAVLADKGITVSDFFASDGFVRGHSFHGKRVLSFEEIQKKYANFVILLVFGSSQRGVIEHICALAAEHPLFAPDVPVCGGELFDGEFFRKNRALFEEARALLCDEHSRRVFDDVISYKLSGDISYLFDADTPKEEAFSHLLRGSYTAYADLGAYTGDTIKEMLTRFPGIRKVIAFEPSAKPFQKLAAYCGTLADTMCRLYPFCAWDKKTDRLFSDGGGRNSAIELVFSSPDKKTASGAKLHSVPCDSLDHAAELHGERLLIKYDVEGSEREAFLGSLETIGQNHTELIVSAYHRSRDLFELPLLIHEKIPNHRLFLRKHPYIPAWDINLYVCAPE